MPLSFEQFVLSSSRRLVHLARMLLGNPSEAEDMVQETYIRVYRRWNRLDEPDAALGYAYRTLIRLTRRHLRAARFRHESSVGELVERASDEPSDVQEDLESVLAGLPRRQREALVLRYFVDLSVRDTARVMRCSEGTVKSQVSRALEALRLRLPNPDQSATAGSHDS